MKILITGHKGFIGSNALKHLQKNHQVITFEWGDAHPKITGLDWVIHIGAISSTIERNVDKVMSQNYDFSVDLYEECLYNRVNFQYSSSASVYGLVSSFEETSPVDPRTPYAWSKYLFERYVKNNPPTNTLVQGFRYFNVYGPGEDHKGGQASPYQQFSQQAKTTGKIKLFEGSDKFLRDFVPVSTVVNIHEQMLSKKVSGVFNVGTGQTKSFQTVAEEVATKYHAEIEYIPMPDILKDSYQKYTCANMTLLNSVLL
jgi:ADP-L-glycero-D-manno-heptose 6-epimerase